jgi:hypothetical protein
VIDFLYDPIKGNCVAWMLDGDVFAESDRKIATTDREGNIYTLDGNSSATSKRLAWCRKRARACRTHSQRFYNPKPSCRGPWRLPRLRILVLSGQGLGDIARDAHAGADPFRAPAAEREPLVARHPSVRVLRAAEPV